MTSFGAAYAAGDARTRTFLDGAFRSSDARVALMRRARPAIAPSVVAAIERCSPDGDAARASLRRLRDGAAVVVTGQQVGLFGGPLYSYYKAASAIATARALTAESGVPCVPLFWLQTEDHDFAEVSAAVVPDGEWLRRLCIGAAHEALGARVSVAHRTLGPDVVERLDELAVVLRKAPYIDEAMARLREAYRPGRTLGQAFAQLLGGLFADDGLLLLDPRQPEIAAAALPLYARALDDHAVWAAALRERAAQLQTAGFDVQVPIRDDRALLFFHAGGPPGDRFRVGSDDCARVRAHLADEPLAASTSALLRPLVQDAILPTVAYVGGPGELSYFAQLPPLYAQLQLRMPLVVPRARLRVVDARARGHLRELQLTASALECDGLAWQALLAQKAWPGDAAHSPSALRAQLHATMQAALNRVDEPTLSRARERTTATIGRAVDRFIGRWERALAERSTATTSRLHRLRARLAPEGHPQERALSLPWALARFGADRWRALVAGAVQPFSGALVEIDA